MKLLVLLLLPASAWAQLVLSVIDGATEIPLAANSVYQMRSMEAGDTQSVRLRVRNTGPQPAEIARFFAGGVGFSLNRPLPPQTLAAGGSLNATLIFAASAPANYSANLQLNSMSVLVLVSVTPGPRLTVPAACLSTAPNAVDFGIVTRGQPKSCELTLTNPTAQAMTVSTLTVTGAGFSLATVAPLSLSAGQSAILNLQVNAPAAGLFTGTLRIQNRDYALRATAVNPLLPVPIFEFETSPAGSGQQRRLTMRLPSPAPATTSGQLHLAFTADSILAADDPAVMFVETASRQIRFAVEEGKTAVTLNNAAFITFQTGTTSGRIRFSLSGLPPGPAGEAESTVILSPVPIALDKTLPGRFPNRMELILIGYDNTFSAGSMNFRFFDAAGRALTEVMPADFTADFRKFFSETPGGSTFQITVRFPVFGSSATVAAVEAELSNSAGVTRTGRLSF